MTVKRNIQILLLTLLGIVAANGQSLEIYNLKCDYKTDPIGIDNLSPSLSWQIKGDGVRDLEQKACQVLVATSEELLEEGKADVWNSGIVESGQSVQVSYSGEALDSKSTYYWTVRVWTNKGKHAVESQVASWEMGLLEPSDWKGKWISAPRVYSFRQRGGELHSQKLMDRPAEQTAPSPYLRNSFSLKDKIKKARLYISGLGYYEAYLNGERVGDHVLDPAWTSYHKRVLYTTYDVTDQVREGKNALGIILGDGWYNQHSVDIWSVDKAPWRDVPKALAQLEIEMEDGTKRCIVSDESWKAKQSPIVFSSIRQGESYDARLEEAGWNTPEYDDADWTHVWHAMAPQGRLQAQELEPMRVKESFKPHKITQPTDSTYVLYYPQDIAGWVKIRIKETSGTKISIKYGEAIREDGTLNQDKLRGFTYHKRFQTDEYICKSSEWEEWHARFTYHGFSTVEITGLSGKALPENFIAYSVYTDMDHVSTFECSDEMINKIHMLTPWSIKGNAHGYAEASPHREKLGWTGDAHLAGEATLLNFDAKLFYRKWIGDMAEDQLSSGELCAISPTPGWGYVIYNGPAWDAAFFLIPWYQYLYAGDIHLLERHYEQMKLYFDYLDSSSTGCIADFGLGDWSPPYSESSNIYTTPAALTSTAYFYQDAVILSKVSALLGYSDASEQYLAKSTEIKEAFHKRFYDPETGFYTSNTQTAQACALYQGLTTPENHEIAVEKLAELVNAKDNHLNTGILGTKYLLDALSENGHEELVYKLVTQKTFPGWGYWIEQGATTMWERWSGKSTGGSGKNFTFLSEVDVWFYNFILGIKIIEDKPAYKQFEISPYFFEKLDWAKGKIATMYGDIEVDWSRNGNSITYNITIPENTSATLKIPNGYRFKKNRQGIWLGSGVHTILLEKANLQ